MVNVTQVRFGDIARREIAERERIAKRIEQLDQFEKVRGILSQDESDERDRLTDIQTLIDNKWDEVAEPLFVGVREFFNHKLGVLGVRLATHTKTGILEFVPARGAAPQWRA